MKIDSSQFLRELRQCVAPTDAVHQLLWVSTIFDFLNFEVTPFFFAQPQAHAVHLD
jgi:hypothetical protein